MRFVNWQFSNSKNDVEWWRETIDGKFTMRKQLKFNYRPFSKYNWKLWRIILKLNLWICHKTVSRFLLQLNYLAIHVRCWKKPDAILKECSKLSINLMRGLNFCCIIKWRNGKFSENNKNLLLRLFFIVFYSWRWRRQRDRVEFEVFGKLCDDFRH